MATPTGDAYLALVRYRPCIVFFLHLLRQPGRWNERWVRKIVVGFRRLFLYEVRDDETFLRAVIQMRLPNALSNELTAIIVFVKLLLMLCTSNRRRLTITTDDLNEIVSKLRTAVLESPAELVSRVPDFFRELQYAAFHPGMMRRCVEDIQRPCPSGSDTTRQPLDDDTSERSDRDHSPPSDNAPTSADQSVFPPTPFYLPPENLEMSHSFMSRQTPVQSSEGEPSTSTTPQRTSTPTNQSLATSESERCVFYPLFKKPVHLPNLESEPQASIHPEAPKLRAHETDAQSKQQTKDSQSPGVIQKDNEEQVCDIQEPGLDSSPKPDPELPKAPKKASSPRPEQGMCSFPCTDELLEQPETSMTTESSPNQRTETREIPHTGQPPRSSPVEFPTRSSLFKDQQEFPSITILEEWLKNAPVMSSQGQREASELCTQESVRPKHRKQKTVSCYSDDVQSSEETIKTEYTSDEPDLSSISTPETIKRDKKICPMLVKEKLQKLLGEPQPAQETVSSPVIRYDQPETSERVTFFPTFQTPHSDMLLHKRNIRQDSLQPPAMLSSTSAPKQTLSFPTFDKAALTIRESTPFYSGSEQQCDQPSKETGSQKPMEEMAQTLLTQDHYNICEATPQNVSETRASCSLDPEVEPDSPLASPAPTQTGESSDEDTLEVPLTSASDESRGEHQMLKHRYVSSVARKGNRVDFYPVFKTSTQSSTPTMSGVTKTRESSEKNSRNISSSLSSGEYSKLKDTTTQTLGARRALDFHSAFQPCEEQCTQETELKEAPKIPSTVWEMLTQESVESSILTMSGQSIDTITSQSDSYDLTSNASSEEMAVLFKPPKNLPHKTASLPTVRNVPLTHSTSFFPSFIQLTPPPSQLLVVDTSDESKSKVTDLQEGAKSIDPAPRKIMSSPDLGKARDVASPPKEDEACPETWEEYVQKSISTTSSSLDSGHENKLCKVASEPVLGTSHQSEKKRNKIVLQPISYGNVRLLPRSTDFFPVFERASKPEVEQSSAGVSRPFTSALSLLSETTESSSSQRTPDNAVTSPASQCTVLTSHGSVESRMRLEEEQESSSTSEVAVLTSGSQMSTQGSSSKSLCTQPSEEHSYELSSIPSSQDIPNESVSFVIISSSVDSFPRSTDFYPTFQTVANDPLKAGVSRTPSSDLPTYRDASVQSIVQSIHEQAGSERSQESVPAVTSQNKPDTAALLPACGTNTKLDSRSSVQLLPPSTDFFPIFGTRPGTQSSADISRPHTSALPVVQETSTITEVSCPPLVQLTTDSQTVTEDTLGSCTLSKSEYSLCTQPSDDAQDCELYSGTSSDEPTLSITIVGLSPKSQEPAQSTKEVQCGNICERVDDDGELVSSLGSEEVTSDSQRSSQDSLSSTLGPCEQSVQLKDAKCGTESSPEYDREPILPTSGTKQSTNKPHNVASAPVFGTKGSFDRKRSVQSLPPFTDFYPVFRQVPKPVDERSCANTSTSDTSDLSVSQEAEVLSSPPKSTHKTVSSQASQVSETCTQTPQQIYQDPRKEYDEEYYLTSANSSSTTKEPSEADLGSKVELESTDLETVETPSDEPFTQTSGANEEVEDELEGAVALPPAVLHSTEFPGLISPAALRQDFKEALKSLRKEQASSGSDIPRVPGPTSARPSSRTRARAGSRFQVLTSPAQGSRMVRLPAEPQREIFPGLEGFYRPLSPPIRRGPRVVRPPPMFRRDDSPESPRDDMPEARRDDIPESRSDEIPDLEDDEIDEEFQELIRELSEAGRYSLLETMADEFSDTDSHSLLFYYRVLDLIQASCLDIIKKTT